MGFQLSKLSTMRGKRIVLDQIESELHAPVTLLIGANGSGKTSLLLTLAGLLPYRGSLILDEKEISSYSRKNMAQMISFVPQLFVPNQQISVQDFILMGRFSYLNFLGQFSAQDREMVVDTMNELGIMGLAKHDIRRVSGGELRKVLIIRALVQNGKWILMDEPTQGLDPYQRNGFFNLIEKIKEEDKKIIMVLHDKEAIQSIGAELLALRAGK